MLEIKALFLADEVGILLFLLWALLDRSDGKQWTVLLVSKLWLLYVMQK